jgi:small GTP-binding protein
MAHVARVVAIGDAGVGKTTLIHRMTTGEYLERTISTIAPGVYVVDVPVRDRTVPLQLWDTAGQELYRSIIPVYFKGAMFAVLAFAVNDEKSFEHLPGWLDEVREHSDRDTETVLVGTKYECRDRAVADERAKEFAAAQSLALFFVSAATGQNVASVLEYIALQCDKRKLNGLETRAADVRMQPMKVKSCC